jgi:putative hemolysin
MGAITIELLAILLLVLLNGIFAGAEIAVPRARILGLRRQAPPEEIKRILLEERHSRMPVYEGSIDHVVGYVIAKELVALALERDLIVLEDLLRPAFFVPESARALAC